MEKPVLARLTARLCELRLQDRSWHATARAVREAVGADTSAVPDDAVWQAVAEAAGVSPLMMKRYDAGLRSIEGIAARNRTAADALLPASFTAAEVAVRLHARDPNAGLRALADLARGSMTIEAVRAALDATPAKPGPAGDRSRTLRERAMMIQRCEDAVVTQAGRLFKRGVTVRRRPSMRLFRKVGFEMFGRDGQLASGADLYLAETPTASRDEFEGVAQSVLLSHYLPSFHLLFGPGAAPATIERTTKVLDTLGAPWVGVAVFGETDEIIRVRAPRGRPVPDRTAEYREMRNTLSQGMRRPEGPDPLA